MDTESIPKIASDENAAVKSSSLSAAIQEEEEKEKGGEEKEKAGEEKEKGGEEKEKGGEENEKEIEEEASSPEGGGSKEEASSPEGGSKEEEQQCTPLNGSWTMFFDNPKLAAPGVEWKDNLKNCGTFKSIELFWSIFNNVKPATKLAMNSNYHVFREGVQPMWEDPVNCEGGKFVFTIPKKESRNGRLDECWMMSVASVLGETLDLDGDQVCGTVVSIRKTQDRIALWLRSSDKDVCVQIGARWKKVLGLGHKATLKFQAHKDAAASGRSFRNEVQFQV